MENIAILPEIKPMKSPITINLSIEAKQLYKELKKQGWELSEEADKIIKAEAKKRKIKAPKK